MIPKKINETKSWFFETINKIGKLLSRLTMRKRREGREDTKYLLRSWKMAAKWEDSRLTLPRVYN